MYVCPVSRSCTTILIFLFLKNNNLIFPITFRIHIYLTCTTHKVLLVCWREDLKINKVLQNFVHLMLCTVQPAQITLGAFCKNPSYFVCISVNIDRLFTNVPVAMASRRITLIFIYKYYNYSFF